MRFFLLVISFSFISQSYCAWINVNSGINDELTSISFLGTTGIITGKKGVYISTNGGTTAGSWVRAQSYIGANDSLLYNHSQFYGSIRCYAAVNKFFFCGEDTVTHTAVVFEYNITNNKIGVLYTGPLNSKFNDLSQNGNVVYVVGNNGLIVSFNQISLVFDIVNTGLNLDLNSISIANNYLVIGSSNTIIRGLINSTFPNMISFSQDSYQNRRIRDVLYITSVNNMYAVGKNILHRIANTVTEPHQYYADSLDANTITNYSGKIFIGTSSGIYRSYNNTEILEFQPATSGYHILGIQLSGTTLFACGKNGTILYTTDQGGNPEPYAQIDFNGGCLNTPLTIVSTKGTVSSCTNFVNSAPVNSNCSNYTHTFSASGTHEIKLLISNGSYSKTITKQVSIVPTPQINLLTEGIDTILCKQEVLDFTIFTAENNVFYSLYKSGNNAYFGSSMTGNGSDLNFQTNLLSQAGNYYLRATSSLADCSANFTQVISISVEKPVSKIYYDVINAETNEDVRFYEHSSEAITFEWHFTNSPTLSTSTLANPTNSFMGIGSSQVTLISGTINNCFDSITIRGPFIYQPYSDDTSWVMINKKTAPASIPQSYENDIMDAIKVHNGVLLRGEYENRILMSRIGDSCILNGTGGYVAKYNNFGILKWIIKAPNNSGFEPVWRVRSLAEDSHGNFYIAGAGSNGFLIDNTGDTIVDDREYLVKTDSLGRFLWSITGNPSTSSSCYFGEISCDKDDNPYLVSLSSGNQAIPLYFNETTVSGTLQTNQLCGFCNSTYTVLKYDPNGGFINSFGIESNVGSGNVDPHLEFDNDNNLFVWGSYSSYMSIHSPISPNDTFNFPHDFVNPFSQMYAVKFNASGIFQWKIRSSYIPSPSVPNSQTQAFDALVDHSGNLYLTGSNNFNSALPQYPFIIVNSDMTTTHFYGGRYFLTKINSNGICEWINGNTSSYYGYGFSILQDADSIYVLGSVREQSGLPVQCNFTGQNNTVVSPQFTDANYFIASYDTLGAIRSISKNGPDFFNMDIADHPKLLKLPDNFFLHTKSSYFYPNFNASDWGFTLTSTGSEDGIQTKFNLQEGITYLPHYLVQTYDTICYASSYTFGDGHTETGLTSTFQYQYQLVTSTGLDSIIKYQIIVNPIPIHYETVEVCSGSDYEIPNDTIFNNIQTDFVYDQLISSQNACDSIWRRQFNVLPLTVSAHSITACQGNDITLDNGNIITSIQQDTLVELVFQSFNGCDSIVTINIHTIITDNQITQNGNSLVASNPNYLYQWVNCTDFSNLLNGQSFIYTPTVSGNYAVILNNNGCIDTSTCFSYTNLSVKESDLFVSIHPNPTSSKTLISFGHTIGDVNIIVHSNDGRKILESSIQGVDEYQLDLSPFEKGTYFIRISAENKNSEFVIVKN